jgi:hypothetical protein
VNHTQDLSDQSHIDSDDLEKFQEMRLRRTSPKPDGRNAYEQLQTHLARELSAYASDELFDTDDSELRQLLIERFDVLLATEKIVLRQSEKHRLIEDVLADVLKPFERKK